MKMIPLLLFLITISFDVLSLLPVENYEPKGILIFLDDSEQKLGAMSKTLVVALWQKAGPIVASMNLLANVLPFYKMGPQLDERVKILKHGALDAAHFDPSQWIIKKVNESLCVLLPYDFLTDQHISIQEVQKVDFKHISEVELKLGLKVNHMESITIDELVRGKHEYATYFNAALSTLFCARVDYRNRSIKQPLWSVYAVGHGAMGKEIVGMQLSEFKKVLDFFEQKINCRLFIYTSCYSAGLNNELIYKDAQSAIQKTYSYAIITEAITDAVVEADYKIAFIDFDLYGQVEIKSNQKLDGFLEDARAETLNYEEIAKNLFALVPEGNWGSGNVPQIKLPGLEWFSVLASAKDVVSIGSILAQSFDSKKKLNIVQYFKTDPKVILLSAPTVPFELVINSNNLQEIISTIPGDSFQTIQKISSGRNIDTILDWFMSIKMLDVRKVFFISQINDTITDVFIENSYGIQYERRAFYRSNGKFFVRARRNLPYFENYEIDSAAWLEHYKNLRKSMKKFQRRNVQPIPSDDIEKIKELFKGKEKREAAKKRIEQEIAKFEKQRQQELKEIISKAKQQFGVKSDNLIQMVDLLKMLERSLFSLKKALNPK